MHCHGGIEMMDEKIAIYLRLSLEEDGNKQESNSIKSQRAIITRFIKEHNEFDALSYLEFSDDGYTGTNFERPGFQKMLDLVKKGKINCIIVKDLSRLGRDYIEVGDYLEHIFPFLGIRFISVNDNYDSIRHIGGMDIALTTLMHDYYSKELSIKVKDGMRIRMKRGNYITDTPYGYKKISKHQLVPDKNTAPIVKRIFQLTLAGKKTTDIAKELNSENIEPPIIYKKYKTRENLKDQRMIWTKNAIIKILHDYQYLGMSTNHTVENSQIRAKSCTKIPKEQWIIHENTHMNIVTKEEFEAVQSILKKRRKRTVYKNTEKKEKRATNDKVYFCGYCGKKMLVSNGKNPYFYCQSGKYLHTGNCVENKFDKEAMERVLFEVYKKQLSLINKNIESLKDKQMDSNNNHIEELEKKIQYYKQKKQSFSNLRVLQYEEYRSKKISYEQFTAQKMELIQKQEDVEKNLLSTKQELTSIQEEKVLETELLDKLCKYADYKNMKEKDFIVQMYHAIERVKVYSKNDIEILWKFDDMLKYLLDKNRKKVI